MNETNFAYNGRTTGDELETKKMESGHENRYCEEVVREPQFDFLEN
jgi:hypothetical protein